jgi:hypothetical protein
MHDEHDLADLDVEEISLTKLTKDIKNAAASLSQDEARYLVDSYYLLQNERIKGAARIRALTGKDTPHETISHFTKNFALLEKQIQGTLTAYADTILVGRWSMSIIGIAGVLAAGLLAHIDIEKAPTSGHIERFGGLDPTIKWTKGTKRPYNARLKVLFWKIGESFVKVSNNEKDYYGKVYQQAKAFYTAKNERGDYAEDCARFLTEKKFRPETESFKAYTAGRLPLAQVHARAKRKAVKLFVSHWHEIAYRYRFGKVPPKPYVIDIAGHAHYLPPPNNPFESAPPKKQRKKK